MLHFNDQASPTCTGVDLRLFFSLRGQQGTIYWHLIVIQCSICISWSRQWASYQARNQLGTPGGAKSFL